MNTHTDFGPFELQSCGENDFTTKTLGLLAFRPKLRVRLIQRLVGPNAIREGEKSSILFFSRIGENFFREAIEREFTARKDKGPGHDLEERCNLAMALPRDFKWARRKTGQLVLPSKWRKEHINAMLDENNVQENLRKFRKTTLDNIQDFVNTEPDLVLHWEGGLLFIEVKVLSGLGPEQIQRQYALAKLLSAVTGMQARGLCLISPDKHELDPAQCKVVLWSDIAELFSDVREIHDYINKFTFFYQGKCKSMVSEQPEARPETAWNMMVHAELPPEDKVATNNPWSYKHLGKQYFEDIIKACRENGILVIRAIWTGKTGLPYALAREDHNIRPNWMVEDDMGNKYTNEQGFRKSKYEEARMWKWSYEDIQDFVSKDTA